ncbi:hypothetical protein BA768_18440 [Chryseobacterium sp. CBo1]|nr:hypothetical protein BA768_18440 [Chryseobacterium sp. CBo1]
MLINLKILWIFYRKLLIPGILFSLFLTFQLGLTLENFSLCFLLIFPLLHYFIYELRFKNEYHFYTNFGFSKLNLWIITIGLAIGLKFFAAFL